MSELRPEHRIVVRSYIGMEIVLISSGEWVEEGQTMHDTGPPRMIRAAFAVLETEDGREVIVREEKPLVVLIDGVRYVEISREEINSR